MATIHHIKFFIDADGTIVCIHHSESDPTNDDPGAHKHQPSGDKVRFRAPRDGGFTVTFDTASPFASGAGFPAPITSLTGSLTKAETLIPLSVGVNKQPFKYSITLAGVTEDPEIIIDDSGGTGASSKAKKKAAKKAPKKKRK